MYNSWSKADFELEGQLMQDKPFELRKQLVASINIIKEKNMFKHTDTDNDTSVLLQGK